jgi:predicted TPR repeat methyltransferase
MLAGRRELAVQHYRKSLQLDPSNENARAMLEKLQR